MPQLALKLANLLLRLLFHIVAFHNQLPAFGLQPLNLRRIHQLCLLLLILLLHHGVFEL